MYYSNQTLRHKITNQLVALHPANETTFNWEIGKETSFIDEDGKIFCDDINNYTHISDFFGRACYYYSTPMWERKRNGKNHIPSKNKYVNTELKRYLVTDE